MAAAKDHIEFIWEGFDKQNQKVKNQITAKSEAIAKAELRRMGIKVQKIKPKPKPLFKARKQKITDANIGIFARQLTTMLKAGIPLVQSVEIISKGKSNNSMAELLLSIKTDIEAGDTLTQALQRNPLYFDHLFCSLVNAGEHAGVLENLLDKIASYKEKTESIKKKIRKALRTPMIILGFAFALSLLLLGYVVPIFSDLYKSMGAQLPVFTQMVVKLSDVIKSLWWIVLPAIGGLLFAFFYFKRNSPSFRNKLDKILLRLPVVGEILEKAAIARFSRTLGTMSASGVPLVEALVSVANATGNYVYTEAVLKMRDSVATGQQLQMSMLQTGLFPNMVVQMVAIGEESGAIDAMLEKVANFYEEEVDDLVDSLSSKLEPFMMVLIGLIVGSLVVAMYLPLFKIGSAIR